MRAKWSTYGSWPIVHNLDPYIIRMVLITWIFLAAISRPPSSKQAGNLIPNFSGFLSTWYVMTLGWVCMKPTQRAFPLQVFLCELKLLLQTLEPFVWKWKNCTIWQPTWKTWGHFQTLYTKRKHKLVLNRVALFYMCLTCSLYMLFINYKSYDQNKYLTIQGLYIGIVEVKTPFGQTMWGIDHIRNVYHPFWIPYWR